MYISFFLFFNNETEGTSLARREAVRRQSVSLHACMHAVGGYKGGKQQCGTSLDKYTNYSFSAETLQSASATV